MTRGKKPPVTTALVPRSGPPDAVLIKDLRSAHALFSGEPATAVCTVGGNREGARIAWDDAEAIDADGSYLMAELATYEIVGSIRACRFFLKEGVHVAAGVRFLLFPMSGA